MQTGLGIHIRGEAVIAGKEDLVTWRTHPVTEVIRKAMEMRINTYLRAIPQYIVKDDQVKARAASGALNAYEELYSELFVDEEPRVEETEIDNYRDPAARPAKET